MHDRRCSGALPTPWRDLPCIVYVATVVKLPQGRTGALLHVAVGRPELPILRVLLKASLSTEEAIATIGHELQHVIEVSTGVPARGGIDFAAGVDPSDRRSDMHQFETEAAIAAAARIRDGTASDASVTRGLGGTIRKMPPAAWEPSSMAKNAHAAKSGSRLKC